LFFECCVHESHNSQRSSVAFTERNLPSFTRIIIIIIIVIAIHKNYGLLECNQVLKCHCLISDLRSVSITEQLAITVFPVTHAQAKLLPTTRNNSNRLPTESPYRISIFTNSVGTFRCTAPPKRIVYFFFVNPYCPLLLQYPAFLRIMLHKSFTNLTHAFFFIFP
jgi:hypothetical protein